MYPNRYQALHAFFNPEPMNTPDPAFIVPAIVPELLNATVYYVRNRGRKAHKVAVSGYATTLGDDLRQWQRQLTEPGHDTELTTVAVVLADGSIHTHVGPMDFYRVSNLRRAGVSFPGKPSTEAMRAK